jgi:GH43 family beta-xylosidase
MNHRIGLPIRAFFGLLLAAALASAPAAEETKPAAPLLRLQADPWVLLHSDGWYYFTATCPEYDRIELRRARSLEGLGSAAPAVIWRKQKRMLVEDQNLWAPELHFLDGKWFIYYAAGTSLAPYDVRIRAIENDSADPMRGEWKDRGKIDTGRNTLCLDATVFERSGARYLLWAQRLTASDSSSMDLYIARMKDPLTLDGEAVMIGRAGEDWEMRDPANLKMQGPAVLARDGRVFVAYSSNATDARYCVGLLEARQDADFLDPASWRKLPGPALESEPASRLFGPGHNSFTTSPDGSVDFIVFHARDYERVVGLPILDPNRATYVRAVAWDSEGRPVFKK